MSTNQAISDYLKANVNCKTQKDKQIQDAVTLLKSNQMFFVNDLNKTTVQRLGNRMNENVYSSLMDYFDNKQTTKTDTKTTHTTKTNIDDLNTHSNKTNKESDKIVRAKSENLGKNRLEKEHHSSNNYYDKPEQKQPKVQSSSKHDYDKHEQTTDKPYNVKETQKTRSDDIVKTKDERRGVREEPTRTVDRIEPDDIISESCMSILSGQKIKNNAINRVNKQKIDADSFKHKFSQLNLKDVNEKIFAKHTKVSFGNFDGWKKVFLDGLVKIVINPGKMIKIVSDDLTKLTSYRENECVFKGRDFTDNSGGRSTMFSIYIAILKKSDGYEINYSYKVLSWTEKSNQMNDNKFLENCNNAIRQDALKEFITEAY